MLLLLSKQLLCGHSFPRYSLFSISYLISGGFYLFFFVVKNVFVIKIFYKLFYCWLDMKRMPWKNIGLFGFFRFKMPVLVIIDIEKNGFIIINFLRKKLFGFFWETPLWYFFYLGCVHKRVSFYYYYLWVNWQLL